jgi:hypothetical protein
LLYSGILNKFYIIIFIRKDPSEMISKILSMVLLSSAISSALTFEESNDAQKLGSMCSAALRPTVTSGPMWIQEIKHEGTAAFNADPSGYKVYRNVKDFGAKGDGITDDTDAINVAINSGNRCGQGCDSSTVVPALVFFPAGTYLVSRPIV